VASLFRGFPSTLPIQLGLTDRWIYQPQNPAIILAVTVARHVGDGDDIDSG
jgi:hypothetical protein